MKKYTLDDIQQVIEENLDLKWIDRLVYKPLSKYYHTATNSDFTYNKQTYIYLIDKKNTSYLAVINFNENRFVIRINGMKIDASEHWKELINAEVTDTQTK